MEFRYRAGEERSRSPPPSTAAASASSGSAVVRVQDGHGGGDGNGAGNHGENSEAVTRPPPASASASDPDGLRRQAAKERIRERILREEAETLALEAEVRRELMEERFPLLRSAYVEGSERAAAAVPPAAMMAAVDSPSPIALEVHSKANASAALPAKRKSPDVAVASTVSAGKKVKVKKPNLTCTVCGVTTTGENRMQDHLKGKSHRRKAAAIAPPMPKTEVSSKANGSAALPPKRKNPSIPAASTVPAAKRSKAQKPPPDLTCMVCGITLTGEKALQDHLKGKSHRRKAAAVAQPTFPEPAEHEQQQEEGGGGGGGGYTPTKLTMLTNAGEMHEVMQMNGFVLCEVCDVRTADRVTMMCHLEGSKHASKAQQALCRQEPGKPPAPAPAATAAPKKSAAAKKSAGITTAGAAGAGGGRHHPETVEVVLEVNGVRHAVRRVAGGFLLCQCCDVKMPSASEGVMLSHLAGKKHATKAMMAKNVAVVARSDSAAASANEVKKIGAAAVGGDSDSSVVVDVGGVQHVVQKVDGFLVCACCDVKAPSERVMRSHLAGKKHRDKANEVAAVHAGAGGKDAAMAEAKPNETSIVAGTDHHGQGNGTVKGHAAGDIVAAPSAPPATPDGNAAPPLAGGASTAPMEVDERTELDDATAVAEEENADAEVNSSATAMAEAVRTNGVAAAGVHGEEVKIQVEGKMFTVLRQANGTLSCGLCGDHGHGYDKDGMLEHLYTRGHWRNARLAEEKQAAAAAANNGGGNQ